MPQIDLGQVVGPQGAQGEPGPQGAQGIQGPAGPAATINGVNALIIEAGNNIELSQSGSTTRLSVPTDAAPTEDSTKPVQSGGVAAALSNKAPAGFGLGTSNPRHIDDANNALESGWYYLDASTLNGPESAEYSNVMLVLTRNSNPQTVQVSFNVTDLAFELRRVCTNGVWSPWEWVNPPMQLGVEYRTTERYSNKPVFVMAVDGGVFPDSSSKTIDVQIPDTSGRVKMLDCYGVLDNGTQIPGLFGESVFNASNYLGLFTQNGNGKFTISVGSGRTVGLNFTLFLKYWKEGT